MPYNPVPGFVTTMANGALELPDIRRARFQSFRPVIGISSSGSRPRAAVECRFVSPESQNMARLRLRAFSNV